MGTTAHVATPRVMIAEETFAMRRKCMENATTVLTTLTPLFVVKIKSDHTLGDHTLSAAKTGATIAEGKSKGEPFDIKFNFQFTKISIFWFS